MALAARIRGLSPFGPIFTKELRISSRRKRNHLVRVLYLGGLFLLLMMMYVSTGTVRSNYYNVAQRVQAQALLGQVFFAGFAMFSVIAMGLISPILTSTAINSERLVRTLPVLLITPITSWQIVSGKLFSRLLLALMLLGLSLPMLAVVRLLGSLEIEQMMSVILLCIAFALFTGAIGLIYSAIFTRTYLVILISYATLFVLYFLVPMILGAALSSRPMGLRFQWIVLALNPVMNVFFLAVPNVARIATGTTAWIPGIAIHLTGTAILLWITSMLVRRHPRDGSEQTAGEPMSAPTPTTEHSDQAGDVATLPAVKEPKPVGENPVLWRELRPVQANRRFVRLAMRIVLYALLISYVLFGLAEVLSDRGLQIGYGVIFNGMFCIGVAVLAGTSIAQEKESDTWTLLLATPLSGYQIVWGKLLGVLRRMFVPFLFIALHFAVFAMLRAISWSALAVVLWVIVSFNSIWAAIGIYLSLSMRKVTPAVVVNLCIPIVIYMVAPFVLLILGQVLANNNDWGEIVLMYLPYFYIGESIDGMPLRRGQEFLYLGSSPVTMTRFVWTVVLVGALHLLISALILVRTASRFDAVVGRAKGSEQRPTTSDNP